MAVGRLLKQVPLPFMAGGAGAFDLHLRYSEVHAWFSGLNIYLTGRDAIYPPATYALLWPFLGWLSWPAARTLFVIVSVGAAAALALLFARESGLKEPSERLLALLLVPASYGTAISIGMGQLGVVVILALVTGILIAVRSDDLGSDILAAALFVFALAKPSMSAPFFWVLLLRPKRLRPALVVLLGYLAATLIAASAQSRPVPALFVDWIRNSQSEAAAARGYGDLMGALARSGHTELCMPVGAILLLLFGLCVYMLRHIDPWPLLGLAALFSRLFAYHRLYDDILIVLPLLALLRLALSGGPGVRRLPGAAFGILLVVHLAPIRLFEIPETARIYQAVQVLSWLGALVCLGVLGWRDERQRRC